MKKYRNQLIILTSTAAMFFVAQPSLWANNSEIERATESNPNKPVLKQETELKVSNPWHNVNKNLIAQIPNPPSGQNTPPPMVPNPRLTIEDNSTSPTPPPNVINPNAPAPAFLPRAVAPPVGDMAISNINTGPALIDLGTAIRVPRLVLREAPVREVLALLARAAGLNLIFTDKDASGETVSLDLANEPVQEVFNSVLLVSGMSANRRGATIYVGKSLPDSARNLISRTIRLNQVDSSDAAAFLASQGASVNIFFEGGVTINVQDTGLVERLQQPPTLVPLTVTGAGGSEPLLLRGLQVGTDTRLNSITLVGEPRQVEMGTSFLTQLDARRRQVAVNVKVIDVELNNIARFGSSFSFGIDDTGVVQDSGVGIINFGTNNGNLNGFPPFGSPNAGEVTPFGSTYDPQSPDGTAQVTAPSNFNVANAFLGQLRSTIVSGNAKILTDPTLVVQEQQVASVRLVEEVITSIDTEVDPLSGVRTITPEIGEAGLILDIGVERIDDNGYIALTVNPEVSVPAQTVNFDSGLGAINQLTLLNIRELDSGLIRLRDGNTLILSGIITDRDRTSVTKVPILGDLPLLGSLFRSSNTENQRTEVIVLLTPQLLDDSPRSNFGYNYSPSRESAEMLRRQGFPVQGQP